MEKPLDVLPSCRRAKRLFLFGKRERNNFKESGRTKELPFLGAHSFFILSLFSLTEVESERRSQAKRSQKGGRISTPLSNIVCRYWECGLACSAGLDQIDGIYQFYVKESKRYSKAASRSVLSRGREWEQGDGFFLTPARCQSLGDLTLPCPPFRKTSP